MTALEHVARGFWRGFLGAPPPPRRAPQRSSARRGRPLPAPTTARLLEHVLRDARARFEAGELASVAIGRAVVAVDVPDVRFREISEAAFGAMRRAAGCGSVASWAMQVSRDAVLRAFDSAIRGAR